MADVPPQSDPARPRSDHIAAPRAEPTTGAPRWVKAFGAVAVVLIVLVVVLLVTGGGNHGPSRHSGSPAGGQIAPASGGADPAGTGHAPRAAGHAS